MKSLNTKILYRFKKIDTAPFDADDMRQELEQHVTKAQAERISLKIAGAKTIQRLLVERVGTSVYVSYVKQDTDHSTPHGWSYKMNKNGLVTRPRIVA